MSGISSELRDTITFVVQKTLSITVALLGASRFTRGAPSETSLAIAQIAVGGALMAVAAIVEVMMWRSQLNRRRGAGASGSADGTDDRLADRMLLLERALVDRLPRPID